MRVLLLRNTLGFPLFSITSKIDICTVWSQIPGQTKRVPPHLVPRHAGTQLLRNTRTTEPRRDRAGVFLVRLVARAGPCALLGVALLAVGWSQPVPNEAALRRVQQAQPRSFAANLALGQLLLESGQAAQAIPFLGAAAAVQPRDVPARHDLAAAYIETGRLSEAQRLVAELQRQAPSPGIVHLEALWLAASGQLQAAAEKFRSAAEADPSEKHLFDLGNHLLNHNAAESAMKIFLFAIERFPQSARLHVAQGVAFYARGEFDQAVRSLSAGVDLNPRDLRPLVFLGLMINLTPESAGAVRQRLKGFANLYPANAQAQYLYGLSLTRAGDPAAEAHLRRAAALSPRMAEPHLELGKLFAESNRPAEAIRALETALRLSPNLGAAHYRLAQLYHRAGQASLAKQHLEAFQKLRPEARGPTKLP